MKKTFLSRLKKGIAGFKSKLKESPQKEESEVLVENAENIDLPIPPPFYTALEIKKIRNKGHYAHEIFAQILNVSLKTLHAWESGEKKPTQSSLRLLEIIEKGIYLPKFQSPRKRKK